MDPETEREFLAWNSERSIPFNRSALAAGVFLGAVQLAVFWVLAPEGLWPWLPPLFANVLASGAALIAIRRPGASRWIQSFVVLNGTLSGIGTVALLSVHLRLSEVSFAATLAFFFLTSVVSRPRPLPAAVGSAAIGVVHLGLSTYFFRIGETSVASFALQAIMGPAIFGAAVQTSLATEVGQRHAFRQERIIERQQATILRERARTEELLRNELSHQVAERSRELGAVLAQSGVTFDVRALKTGERFAERYRIVASLGAGGMGAVYEVERVTDGERLALKAVVGELTGASAARFAREAEIGARVRHPNLISIVDVGVSSGVPFLAMELVRGGSLEAQRSRFGDVEWALPILKQIAEGLAALHDAAVVHRDLKPANVLLADGVAKISDFGISRFGAFDQGVSIDPNAATMATTPKRVAELTGTGVMMGTPLYMAPEAARSARALDSSADVFALGIIAYEMLTGRSPFAVPAFLLAMAEQPIPAPPPIDDARVPAAVRARLQSCLASDPARRPRVRGLIG